MSFTKLQSWVAAANSGLNLDNEVNGIFTALNELLAALPPVGSEVFLEDANPDTPAYGDSYVEANGQVISDADSPYNGKRIRNLNGATVSGIAVLSLDNSAKTVTIATANVYALMIGDALTFTGASVSNAVVKAINYSTGVVTVGDSTLWTSGTYELTPGTLTGANTLTSVGLKRFARGNSSNTGGGGVNTLQGFSIDYSTPLGAGATFDAGSAFDTEVRNSLPKTDGVNGTPRTGTDTQPNFFDGVWLKKIKQI